MTNEQVLEKQVEALEKLLQLRGAIIEELEVKVNKLEAEKFAYPNLGPSYAPGIWGIPGSQQYPGVVTTPYVGPSSGSITISTSPVCSDGGPHHVLAGTVCAKCNMNVCFGSLTGLPTTGYISPITAHGHSTQGSNLDIQANQGQNTVYTLKNAIK